MALNIFGQKIPVADCKHINKKDLTQGLGETRNHYCPDCKMHWYNGRTWTMKEWDAYVELPEKNSIE